MVVVVDFLVLFIVTRGMYRKRSTEKAWDDTVLQCFGFVTNTNA